MCLGGEGSYRMRILRGFEKGTRVTIFLTFALITASSLTIFSPRPASAEGPLLGAVKCLVRTVLLSQCPTTTTPVPSTSVPSPAPSPASAPPQPVEQSQPVQQSQRPNTQATERSSQARQFDTIEPIQTSLAPYEDINATAALRASQGRIKESDYVAYFNQYSKYAVAGAEQPASIEAPIAQSAEGWKILGIAWYWWGAIVVILSGIFLSVKKGFLRRSSVLSKTP